MKLRLYQEGGAAPAGGQDPVQQLIQAAAQAVQNNDGNLALQVCAALVQLAQGSTQQQEQPAEEEAPEEAPAADETGEPVFGRGGRLVGRFRR